MKKYKFHFEGRQVRAIGITYKILDTYKANNLGEALFMLYSDYEHIKRLVVYEDKSEPFKYREPEIIPNDIVKNTELIKIQYPRRETSPRTGTYKYSRMDAPDNYKW